MSGPVITVVTTLFTVYLFFVDSGELITSICSCMNMMCDIILSQRVTAALESSSTVILSKRS